MWIFLIGLIYEIRHSFIIVFVRKTWGEICVTPMLFSLSFLPEITTMSWQATDPLANLLTSIRSELKNADMLGSYAERTIDFFNAVM